MPRGLPITVSLAILVVVGLACTAGPGAGPSVEPVVEHVPPVADEGLAEAAPVPRPAPSRAGDPSPLEPQEIPVEEPGVAEESPEGDETIVLLNRAGLEQDLASVENISEVIGLRPHLTLRGIDGFTVTELPPSSPLAGIGLQQGDVIHAVNGRELTSIKAAFEAGDALQNAEVLEGEITRDGQRRRLVVRFE